MLIHWLWLATREGLSDRRRMAVLRHFQDPEDAFYATNFEGVEDLTESELETLQDKSLSAAKRILAQCTDLEIQILTMGDERYPARLKNIPDPPTVLYYKGSLPEFDKVPVIGVVGTRSASIYGCNTARRLGYQISKCGGLLVSGCAKGIDAMAMSGAMQAGGCAVGVLGCGVDVVYPAANRSLFSDMERNGCLISEFPPETPPVKWNFPKRNRIISGISNGVLVVEAPERSGSLITARQALEQGRDLFVVPGNIDVPNCAGSNLLLREGATAVSTGWDILSEYEGAYPQIVARNEQCPVQPSHEEAEPQVAQKPLVPKKKSLLGRKKDKKVIDNKAQPPYIDVEKSLPALNEEERAIVEQLMKGERLTDEVIALSGLPSGRALSLVTMLQMKGVIVRLPGNRLALK